MAGLDGSIGYQGSLQLLGNYSGQNPIVPFTQCNIEEIREVFSPQLVSWNRTNSAYRSPWNYSLAKTYTKGSFSTEYVVGSRFGTAMSILIISAIEGNPISLAFNTANAKNTFINVPNLGVCYISSASISCQAGSLVSCSFEILSTDSIINDIGNQLNTSQLSFESIDFVEGQNIDDGNPLPWFSCSILSLGTGDDSLINSNSTNWSISINNSPEMIWALTGMLSPVASDLRLGQTSVSGSLSYYPNQEYNDLVDGSSITFYISNLAISLPYLIFNNKGSNNQGLNQIIPRNISFTGTGNNKNKVISASIV